MQRARSRAACRVPGVFFAEALFAAAGGDDDAAARWLAGAVERSPRAAEAAAGEPTLAAALRRLDD